MGPFGGEPGASVPPLERTPLGVHADGQRDDPQRGARTVHDDSGGWRANDHQIRVAADEVAVAQRHGTEGDLDARERRQCPPRRRDVRADHDEITLVRSELAQATPFDPNATALGGQAVSEQLVDMRDLTDGHVQADGAIDGGIVAADRDALGDEEAVEGRPDEIDDVTGCRGVDRGLHAVRRRDGPDRLARSGRGQRRQQQRRGKGTGEHARIIARATRQVRAVSARPPTRPRRSRRGSRSAAGGPARPRARAGARRRTARTPR
jgi:hypothetical protein